MLPTVGELLALPALVEGMPEVLVGEQALEAPVRWVHVSDSAGVARLLEGGELLLSTGSGWPEEPVELSAFIAGLVDAGLSGLVLELGAHYHYAPAVVVQAAATHGLALVALHREVKFVTVTQAVHSRIISEQTSALRALDELHALFTSLSLRGSPADYIVRQLGHALRSTVVLENLAHEVVALELGGESEEDVLTRWEPRSRLAHRATEQRSALGQAARSPEDWLIVPVEARGIRWGSLVALPGPPHPAGRANVLEQGAIALAFGRLGDAARDTDEWTRLGQQRLVDELLEGRFGARGAAAARVDAAGLPVDGRTLVGLAVTGAGAAGPAVVAAAREQGAAALAAARGDTTVAMLSLPGATRFDDQVATRFAHDLARLSGAEPERVVVHVGGPAHDLPSLLTAVQEAIELSRSRPSRQRGPLVKRVDDRPLARLVTALRDDHRLQEHSERMLAPLIEYDLARGGDLLQVLGAALAHPGNRTAAASASHLSRSVFYQRIALISDLLGADLDDGETLTALHLALLARQAGTGR
ncbi:PucR family transcriptional regulator [Agromyces mangrovi Wang et al. 2018]|uniref:PucR family transcriptional regulator n=1 Tax=Agromyces mangrovi TaxID=1858653 RepID=UPI0033057128|nr:hypothetical protein GCM10025877_20880 [Agromyces mangrovi]